MFPILFYLKIVTFVAFVIVTLTALGVILWIMARHYQTIGNREMLRRTRILRFIVFLPILLPLFLGPIVWFYATNIEPNWIDVKTITVRDQAFDPGLENVTIALISDLHIEHFGRREKKLVKLIQKINPDVILMAGDYINSSNGWDVSMDVISKLKAKRGTYAIIGNTDYIFGLENEIVKRLNANNVQVLLHDNIKLDFGENGQLWLAGLSDKHALNLHYGGEKLADETFAGIPEDEAKLLLIHDPEHADFQGITNYRPNLILAGDTHGGQIGIAFLRQFSDYANRGEHMSGMYTLNGMPLYVNRGIGMKTLYLRLLCRPEITLIKLVKPN